MEIRTAGSGDFDAILKLQKGSSPSTSRKSVPFSRRSRGSISSPMRTCPAFVAARGSSGALLEGLGNEPVRRCGGEGPPAAWVRKPGPGASFGGRVFAVSAKVSPMTAEERWQMVRAMVQHEDALREQRLGWLLALNGFLFAALGLAVDQERLRVVTVIVALVGFVVAVSGALSMQLSDVTLKEIEAWLNKQGPLDSGLPPVRGMTTERLRKLRRETKTSWFVSRFYFWHVTPVILAVGWCAILVVLLTVQW